MPFPARTVPTRQDIEDVYLENTTNILQKTSVSNMIGLLNQLNKISIFASEIFKDILDTTNKNGQRIKKVSSRLQSVSSSLDSAEQMFLVNSPAYFYDNPYTGKEWQRKDPLRGLLFRRDRSEPAVNRRRDVGLPLPDLSKLDRISMTGPCIKKFSDSNFFMNQWLEAEKKKMEEEKAKRRERKKKRKRKKREVKDTILSIEKWVYDPVTGKKVLKKATAIKVDQKVLSDDTNASANVEFDSSEAAVKDRTTGMSVYEKMAHTKAGAKSANRRGGGAAPPPIPEQVSGGPPPMNPAQAGAAPPPVPAQPAGEEAMPEELVRFAKMLKMGVPEMAVRGKMAAEGWEDGDFDRYLVPGGGGGGAPKSGGRGGPGAAPPPNPMMGGPPPNPVSGPPNPPMQQQAPMSPAERAQRMMAASAQQAEASGAYRQAAPAQNAGPPRAPMGGNRMNLLAGIRGGAKLKSAGPIVKRKPKMEKRDMLLSALRQKGQSGLKKVAEEDKNVRVEEKQDATIFAILNRRQFMADESESDTGSDWDSDES